MQNLQIKRNVIKWLDNHNDEKRKKMIDNVFNLFEESGIDNTSKFRNMNSIISIIKNVRTIDRETKDLVIEFISNIFFKN